MTERAFASLTHFPATFKYLQATLILNEIPDNTIFLLIFYLTSCDLSYYQTPLLSSAHINMKLYNLLHPFVILLAYTVKWLNNVLV